MARNGVIKSFLLLTFVAFLHGAEPLDAWAADAERGSIRIGILNPYTGPLAKIGENSTNGFKLYLDEIGNRVAGRRIELILEDDEAKPAVGLTKVRKLVERDRVHMLAGIISSAVAYAVRDYVHNNKVPLIIMGSAGANDLTAERKSPYIFRTSFTNRQFNAPFGWYAYKKLGFRRVILMASDFVTGKEQAVAFREPFEALGGKVVREVSPPLGTTDFAPYLTRVRPDEADAVWAMFFGSDAIRFVTQYSEYGLKGRVQLLGSAGLAEVTLLPSMGENAIGMLTPTWYTSTLDNPENRAMSRLYQDKYREEASEVVSSAYVASMATVKALGSVGGRAEDTPRLLEALRKVQFNSPQGPFRFDQNQNVVFSLYATRVERVSGKLVRRVIEKIADDVEQFWSPLKEGPQ